MKLTATIIIENRLETKFMQAAACFEPFKVLANIAQYDCSDIPDDCDFSDLVTNIRKAIDNHKYRAVAVLLSNTPQYDYIDTKVKVISDGSKFSFMVDVLEALRAKPAASEK